MLIIIPLHSQWYSSGYHQPQKKMETVFFSFFQIKLLLLLGNVPKVSLSCASPGRLGKTYPNPLCLMTTTMRYQSHHPLGGSSSTCLWKVPGSSALEKHQKNPQRRQRIWLHKQSSMKHSTCVSISKCGKSLGKGRKTTSELLKMLLLIDVKDGLVIIT